MSVTCSPTVEPTTGPSLYTPTASGFTSSDMATPDSQWMFNQQNNNGEVQAAFGLNDGNTLGVMGDANAQQYVVMDSTGRVYPTCVQHGASGAARNADYYTWNGNTAGAASEQRSALLAAAVRNDFKNANCPSLVDSCTAVSNYYRNDIEEFTGTDLNIFDNLCIDEYGSLMYVMQDFYKHVCVGMVQADSGSTQCPLDGALTNSVSYFCGGINGGLATFGWGGQMVGAIEKAFLNAVEGGTDFSADSFTHPQCRV